MAKDITYCQGCRDNFYNGGNHLGVKECWGLKSAKVVKRFRIGWWTTPDTPGAFTEVKTHHCNYAPGQYGFYNKLPSFAVEPKRLKLRKARGETT